MPHTCRGFVIGEQTCCQAVHDHRWYLTALVLLPFQQHLGSVASSIDIERELLKPELLIRVLPELLIGPANVKGIIYESGQLSCVHLARKYPEVIE